MCRIQLPWVPLRDILSEHERIDLIERELANLGLLVSSIVPRAALADIRKDLNSITGEIRHFEVQFNEHIALGKRKKLQKQVKQKERGTVDV